MSVGTELAERGLVPTPLVRRAIRRLCAQRLREAEAVGARDRFLARIARSRIAEVPDLANAQHYEVASDFFGLVLGRRRKYSSALWPAGVDTLDDAEEAMLALTAERARLGDGQDILELGCGWGSLSLYLTQRYPASRITAVSNSASQREFLLSHRVPNLEVCRADMNEFDPGRRFDRIVSVEMFEHMRDWPRLLERVSRWLRDNGRIFVHVFCHASHAYTFEGEGDDNWMGRHFFSGGIMPGYGLLAEVAPASLRVEADWWIDGTHYRRTAAAWRENMESRRDEAMRVLRRHYGAGASVWYRRWRLFFLACEELFGYDGGREWGVGHYRLRPAGSGAESTATEDEMLADDHGVLG
jgi:cyclopropane-fatty-acyl-phospholipid synthase